MLPVRKYQTWLPTMFNDFFDNDWMERANATQPAINVKEDAQAFTVEVAAPGMSKENFSIRIDEDNNLVLSMENKTQEKKDEKPQARYLRREFAYSRFEQQMELPENVDKAHISAKMEKGILEITLPKLTPEQVKKAQRQIDIA